MDLGHANDSHKFDVYSFAINVFNRKSNRPRIIDRKALTENGIKGQTRKWETCHDESPHFTGFKHSELRYGRVVLPEQSDESVRQRLINRRFQHRNQRRGDDEVSVSVEADFVGFGDGWAVGDGAFDDSLHFLFGGQVRQPGDKASLIALAMSALKSSGGAVGDVGLRYGTLTPSRAARARPAAINRGKISFQFIAGLRWVGGAAVCG